MRVDLSGSFAVVVHDVAPVFERPTRAILRELAPRIGDRMTAAVVPCWRGVPWNRAGDRDFLRVVEEDFGEILQHGFTHRHRGYGLVSILSGGANEFAGLSIREARTRLKQGRELLGGLFGSRIAGFLPPAWQAGRVAIEDLGRVGFEYTLGFRSIRFVDGRTIRLATWSWDWGVLAALGYMGEKIGDAVFAARPDVLPCLAIHPIDVDRGFLRRILRLVDRLAGEGRSPILLSELASNSPKGSEP